MCKQLSTITTYNRCTLYSIGVETLDRPNPQILTRLKQLGILRYRDSRGGLNKCRRVWDTYNGVHLNNITLPQAIHSVPIDMNRGNVKVADPKHRELSKVKQEEPVSTKAQKYLSVCSINPRSVKNFSYVTICNPMTLIWLQ